MASFLVKVRQRRYHYQPILLAVTNFPTIRIEKLVFMWEVNDLIILLPSLSKPTSWVRLVQLSAICISHHLITLPMTNLSEIEISEQVNWSQRESRTGDWECFSKSKIWISHIPDWKGNECREAVQRLFDSWTNGKVEANGIFHNYLAVK